MSSRYFVALGTASQVPTKERNHNGYFLRWDKEGLLFDPGEGTQRQMTIAGIPASAITRIFVTHFHGDHCLGLPGILQRLSLDNVRHPIALYYPAYGAEYIQRLRTCSVYFERAEVIEHPFATEGTLHLDDAIHIETRRLDHAIESWGYRLTEHDRFNLVPEQCAALGLHGHDLGRLKREGEIVHEERTLRVEDVSVRRPGQRFAFIMDTRLCPGAYALAREVDMLVCESTFLATESEQAQQYGHLTAHQAASLASGARAQLLVLTHFSQRYTSLQGFADEAGAIHPNIVLARDGLRIDLKRAQV